MPIAIVLDADDEPQFAAAVANVRFLESRTMIPQLIVVGIPSVNRTHELTPVAHGNTARDEPNAGGAERFFEFIRDDVIPHVRTRHGARGGAILVGHSFGGLFALNAAANHPGTFVGTIAASPSLWWNDSSVVSDYAERLNQSTTAQRIFVSAGSYEQQIGRLAERFASLVHSSLGGTAVTFMRYENDTHGLTPQPSVIDGLRFVFAPISPANLPIARLGPGVDSTTVVNAVTSTISQYAQGARALGLPEPLPAEVLTRLGYNVLSALKKPGLAAWVFERSVALHPDDASARAALADALAAGGDTAMAVTHLATALMLARRSSTQTQRDLEAKLRALCTVHFASSDACATPRDRTKRDQRDR